MGMTSLIFDPHPPNFANLHNFLRCTNDIIMTFWNSFWFQIYKKPQRVIRPGNSVVHGLPYLNFAQPYLGRVNKKYTP